MVMVATLFICELFLFFHSFLKSWKNISSNILVLLTGCIVYIGEGFPLLVIYDQAGWKGGGKVKRSCTFFKKKL
jgi:hypothetical protein